MSKEYTNYLVTFDGLDLEHERFTKDTNFWLDYIQPKMIIFNHLSKHLMQYDLSNGQLVPKDNPLPLEYYVCGEITNIEIDDNGVLAKYVIYDSLPEHVTEKLDLWSSELDKEHQLWLGMVRHWLESGKLAFSSDTMLQLAQREYDTNGKAIIKSWPMPYVSLTHIPAEPRNNQQVIQQFLNEIDISQNGQYESLDIVDKATPQFRDITYNGVSCQATNRRSSPVKGKAWQRTVRYQGKEKKVSYADSDMPMRRNNPEARDNFLARHNCSDKKDPFSAGFWSCYDWQNINEGKKVIDIMENENVEPLNELDKMDVVSDTEKMESSVSLDELASMLTAIKDMIASMQMSEVVEDTEKMDAPKLETEDTMYKGEDVSELSKKVDAITDLLKNRETGKFATSFNVHVDPAKHDDSPYKFQKAIRLMRNKPSGYQSQMKALGLLPASSGGFTTQVQQSNELIDLLLARSIFLRGGDAERLVDLMPMTSDTATVPVLSSGGTAYWIGENSSITTSDPTFEQRTLVAKKLAMLIPISNELLADNSVQLENRLRETMVKIMLNSVDQTVLFGSGVANQPLGLRSHAGVTQTALNALPTYDNLVDAIARLEASNVELDNTTAWLFHPTEKQSLRKIKDGAGQLIWTDSTVIPQIAGGMANSLLLGYNWIANTNVLRGQGGNAATEGDIFLGRWSDLIVGMRNDIEISVSDTAGTAFQNDQTWIRAIMRMDVAVKHPESFEILTDVLTS